MSQAVIVATARSPIGRANKGSLVDLRPDDMSAQIVRALMAKVPQVKASDVEDLIMGIGQPAGEGGFNIGRMVAILAGLDDVPGVTVNRYCSSSLQTIRMAAHAIRAGEGDVLCFLPGAGEIARTIADLQSGPLAMPGPAAAARPDRAFWRLLPLHGSLDAAAQDLALRPAAAGERRVIVATNIAETVHYMIEGHPIADQRPKGDTTAFATMPAK